MSMERSKAGAKEKNKSKLSPGPSVPPGSLRSKKKLSELQEDGANDYRCNYFPFRDVVGSSEKKTH